MTLSGVTVGTPAALGHGHDGGQAQQQSSQGQGAGAGQSQENPTANQASSSRGGGHGHGNGDSQDQASSPRGGGHGNGDSQDQASGQGHKGSGPSQSQTVSQAPAAGPSDNSNGNGHGHHHSQDQGNGQSQGVGQDTQGAAGSPGHKHGHDAAATAASAPTATTATPAPTATTATPAPTTPVPSPVPTPAASATPAAKPSVSTGLSVFLPDRHSRQAARRRPLAQAPGGFTAGTPSTRVTGALAPGTATIGTPSTVAVHIPAQAGHRAHRVSMVLPPLGTPVATVIARFIDVIPTGVWIALAASLGLAAIGGGAALRSARRARRQAGEVAAVTAAAVTDPLTGVLNRRGFTEAAARELDRARRYAHPLALAFVDVRGLKQVNDTEGHLAGDALIKQVAILLRESARVHDVVGRIGGDELAVLLAEQSAEGASAMAERVRALVPAHRAAMGLNTSWDVTVGTATFPEDGESFDDLLAAADRRLYEQRGIELNGRRP